MASALGIAVVAAFTLSGIPGLGLAVEPSDTPNSAIAPAVYVQPVRVSLLSEVDAISRESLEFTSTALGRQLAEGPNVAAANLEFGLAGQGASTLAGQSQGARGMLPGQLRLIHPVISRHITSPYGWRNNPTGPGTQVHIGQDYATPCGSPVYATADGTIVQSAWAGHSGMRVTIDHGNSVRTGYSHNSRLIAKVGDEVKQGQVIALSGTTGNSTGCHVHFEVIVDGRWNDPRNFLSTIPGQPSPMFDSRDTKITAEPIRNSGAPHYNIDSGHDLEIKVPWKPVVRDVPEKPKKASTGSETKSKSPSKETAKGAERTPVKKSETKPSPASVPQPSTKPVKNANPSAPPKPTPGKTPETTQAPTKPQAPPGASTKPDASVTPAPVPPVPSGAANPGTSTKPDPETAQTPPAASTKPDADVTPAPAPIPPVLSDAANPGTSTEPDPGAAPSSKPAPGNTAVAKPALPKVEAAAKPPASPKPSAVKKPADAVVNAKPRPAVPAKITASEAAALSDVEIATLLKRTATLSAAEIKLLREVAAARATRS